MNILGLSFDYHDAAAALLVNGRLVAAGQEERFTRRKHDAGLPENAARFCLETAGLAPSAIDRVVFYERPLVKLDRLRGITDDARFEEILARWLVEGRLDVRGRIQRSLGIPADRVSFVDHHQAHAASAFFCSPFDQAAVLTVDGVGEHETASISAGRNGRLERLGSVSFPDSLGLFYSGFTAFLGFEVNEGEYKVMGMAGFGRPRFFEEIRAAFRLTEDGLFTLCQDWFRFDRSDALPFLPALTDWLGPPRRPGTPFMVDDSCREADLHYADIAASIQKVTEEVLLHMAKAALARVGTGNLCLAGGVALNSVANDRLRRQLGCRLYVQPAAGDGGGALGAALSVWHDEGNAKPGGLLPHCHWGRAFADEDIEAFLGERGTPYCRFDDDARLIEFIADCLAADQVVGWFQGRAEWGPRALGSRSILASPIGPHMQRLVNEKVKFREPFRPFAPSVAAERAAEFFDLAEGAAEPGSPEHFMLSVCPVRASVKERIPAVTHVDGTARVHLVEESVNPLFHGLICAFGRRTGIPVLLNTSFNLKGEPIVDTPADALDTFSYSNIDHLVLGRIVVSRSQLNA